MFRTELSNFGPLENEDLKKTRRPVPLGRIEGLRVLTLTLLREVDALADTTDAGVAGEINLADEVRRFEAEVIRSTLVRTGGRQRRAAKLLGMKVSTLNAKIKRYNINPSEEV